VKVEQSADSALAAGLEYAGKAPATEVGGADPAEAAEGLSRVGTEGTTMQELRFVAVSEDGRYAVLAVPGRSARFTLPIDERLRAVALGQTSRLAQYEIEVESPLRPKEIQARIRAGETVEEIADAAGIAVERVRWFEGPVLAERAYMADQAQTASVRRHGDSTPGPRLGEVVTERLNAIGADPDDAQWDAKKRGDGSWQVQLTFTSGGRLHTAEWVFDPRRRHVLPADDNAVRMSLPGAEPPQPTAPLPGEATVTQLAPRLGGARHERLGPGRPPVVESVPHPPAQPVPPAPAPMQAAPPVPVPAPSAPPVPVTAEHTRTAEPTRAAEPRRTAGHTRTAEPGTQVPRPAAERNSWPRPASPEPAPAPRVAADSARQSQQTTPPPAETAAEPLAETAITTGDAVAPGTPVAPVAPSTPGDVAAQAEPVAEQTGRQGRKAARGRRSSVPSWDEIMFGSSRQRD
jgi:Protein of unknown function (DUF3071)